MARLPQSHPGIPPELDRYLTPAEKIVFRTRMHAIRITGPWLVFFIALLLVAALGPQRNDTDSGNGNGWNGVLVIGLLLILLWAVWRTFLWYREWFVGTDRRLMLTRGILTRKIAMIPLSKVTDMRYDRPPIGQILGYGSFVLESAGQDQAFRVVEYVPHPDTLYRRISVELFTPSETRFLDRPAPGPKVLPVQEQDAPWWKRS